MRRPSGTPRADFRIYCLADISVGRRPKSSATSEFVQVIREQTGGRGVDVIWDMVGGHYFSRNIEALAFQGRLVQIAFLKGAQAEINLIAVMQRRLTITGSTLRPRSVEEKINCPGAAARVDRAVPNV